MCMHPVRCDAKGRLLLRRPIRDRYGDSYYVIPGPGRVLLVPVPRHPLADLREEGRKLPDVPAAKLREEIRKEARKEVLRHTRTRTSSLR